ncbi:Nucleoporin [Lachnellula suecica]|uniref:Nucleoporin n=1 Tax=Lachnellula suecica TaxID=602035 RepID=A0A8T9C7T8_9HELO|nr:Nucleoporin [Lachnellula suecica]
MSSTADADPNTSTISDQPPSMDPQPDVIEAPQHLPARTMAEERFEQSTETPKDDPATAAASEELKHTTISDKVLPASHKVQDPVHLEHGGGDKPMEETAKESTPEADPADARDEEMRERISSPKKKRGRDQDDDTRELEDISQPAPGSAADGGVVNGSRTMRSGPEKKRPRDTSEDYTKATEQAAADAKVMATADTTTDAPKPTSTVPDTTLKSSEPSQKPTFGSGFGDKSPTSSSAFASSGFASLASSSTSPFGSLGASKPSVFGSGASQPAVSGFGALAGAKSPGSTSTIPSLDSTASSDAKPSLSLGFGSGTSSGFGGLGGGSGSVFGSRLGNGFASGSASKLSSFAAPGKENVVATKPAKAFGAPESDNEGSDEDDSDGAAASDDEDGGNVAVEEKKKPSKITKGVSIQCRPTVDAKLMYQTVHIEDGESGEQTLLQMRAKLFAIESKETGWKERGVGTLKINVPKSCVSFDEDGAVIPGSFDASGLEDEDENSNVSRVARLIMRQENTHRVVLNTIIVRAMEFTDKPSNNSVQILFTAFEGDKEPKPINMLLKMSEANARLFRSEIESIQHEL